MMNRESVQALIQAWYEVPEAHEELLDEIISDMDLEAHKRASIIVASRKQLRTNPLLLIASIGFNAALVTILAIVAKIGPTAVSNAIGLIAGCIFFGLIVILGVAVAVGADK